MYTTHLPTRHVTIADTYRAICAGEPPWVALSEFLHAWYEAEPEQSGKGTVLPPPLP
jgi:hypothetical protein